MAIIIAAAILALVSERRPLRRLPCHRHRGRNGEEFVLGLDEWPLATGTGAAMGKSSS